MLKCILVCLIVFAAACAFAQPNPPVRWQRTCPGGAHGVYVIMAATPDGGYGVAQGDRITSIDSNGVMLWSRSYSLTQFGDSALCIEAVGNNGFIVGGAAFVDSSDHPGQPTHHTKAFLLRLSANGDSTWCITWGSDTSHAVANSVFLSTNGNFLVSVGSTLYPAAYDSTGLWEISPAGNVVSYRPQVWLDQRAPGGGFISRSYSSQLDTVHICRYNSFGDSIGQVNLVSPPNLQLINLAALRSGFAASGDRFDSSYTAVVRYDSLGNMQWVLRYHLARDVDRPGFFSIVDCPDGGFVFPTDSTDGIHLVRTDAAGNVRWIQTYTESAPRFAWARYVLPAADGGYAIADEDWSPSIIRTGPDMTLGSPSPLSPYPSVLSLSSYPNPFNPTATISFSLPQAEVVTLTVFDILGQQVQALTNRHFDAGEHSLLFDGSNLSSGIYFAQLQAGSVTRTQKLMLMR